MPKKSRGKLSYVKHRYGNKSRLNRPMLSNIYTDTGGFSDSSPGSSTENEALLLLNFAVSCQRDAHPIQLNNEISTDNDINISGTSSDIKATPSSVVPFSLNGVNKHSQ